MTVSLENDCCIGVSHDMVYVWDINTGQALYAMEGHEFWINKVNFIKNGNYCISGGSDYAIRIWDVPSGQCLRKLITLEGINLYGVDLSKATISPDEFAEVLRQNGAVIESSIN